MPNCVTFTETMNNKTGFVTPHPTPISTCYLTCITVQMLPSSKVNMHKSLVQVASNCPSVVNTLAPLFDAGFILHCLRRYPVNNIDVTVIVYVSIHGVS